MACKYLSVKICSMLTNALEWNSEWANNDFQNRPHSRVLSTGNDALLHTSARASELKKPPFRPAWDRGWVPVSTYFLCLKGSWVGADDLAVKGMCMGHLLHGDGLCLEACGASPAAHTLGPVKWRAWRAFLLKHLSPQGHSGTNTVTGAILVCAALTATSLLLCAALPRHYLLQPRDWQWSKAGQGSRVFN